MKPILIPFDDHKMSYEDSLLDRNPFEVWEWEEEDFEWSRLDREHRAKCNNMTAAEREVALAQVLVCIHKSRPMTTEERASLDHFTWAELES